MAKRKDKKSKVKIANKNKNKNSINITINSNNKKRGNPSAPRQQGNGSIVVSNPGGPYLPQDSSLHHIYPLIQSLHEKIASHNNPPVNPPVSTGNFLNATPNPIPSVRNNPPVNPPIHTTSPSTYSVDSTNSVDSTFMHGLNKIQRNLSHNLKTNTLSNMSGFSSNSSLPSLQSTDDSFFIPTHSSNHSSNHSSLYSNSNSNDGLSLPSLPSVQVAADTSDNFSVSNHSSNLSSHHTYNQPPDENNSYILDKKIKNSFRKNEGSLPLTNEQIQLAWRHNVEIGRVTTQAGLLKKLKNAIKKK